MRILTVPHTPWALLALIAIAWTLIISHLIETTAPNHLPSPPFTHRAKAEEGITVKITEE